MVTIKKLRDYVIPFNEYLHMVRYVEGCPFYDITVKICENNKFRDIKATDNNLFFLPYAYSEPVSAKYASLQASNTAIDEQSLAEWCKMISARVEINAKSAITSDMIKQVDNDRDCGLIVHMSSGFIIPFTYSTVNDLMCEQFSPRIMDIFELYNKMANLRSKPYDEAISPNVADAEKALKKYYAASIQALQTTDSHIGYYKFSYTAKDKWNTEGLPIPAIMMGDNHISAADVYASFEHVLKAFNNKEKIIFAI